MWTHFDAGDESDSDDDYNDSSDEEGLAKAFLKDAKEKVCGCVAFEWVHLVVIELRLCMDSVFHYSLKCPTSAMTLKVSRCHT